LVKTEMVAVQGGWVFAVVFGFKRLHLVV
jgi:hypothetical protein